jgi:hypothetical protein
MMVILASILASTQAIYFMVSGRVLIAGHIVLDVGLSIVVIMNRTPMSALGWYRHGNSSNDCHQDCSCLCYRPFCSRGYLARTTGLGKIGAFPSKYGLFNPAS